jgi:hypothetical protein
MAGSEIVRALASAEDVSQKNRARISLARHGTPDEVWESMKFTDQYPAELRDWFRRTHDYCFWEHVAPKPFIRTRLDREWTSFCGPGEPGNKELLVGFAGAMRMMFLPPAAILQRLDPASHDLLIVRDGARNAFAGGAAGSQSFDELLELIRAASAPYRSVLVIGASQGGRPALEAGLALGARRAISLCGAPTAGVAATKAEPTSPTELWSIHGAENEGDASRAKVLQDMYLNLYSFAISGIRDHNLLHGAFRAGTLGPLFQMMISEEAAIDSTTYRSLAETVLVDLKATVTPPKWVAAQSRPRRIASRIRHRLLRRHAT